MRAQQSSKQSVIKETQDSQIETTLDLISAGLDRTKITVNTPEPQTPNLAPIFSAIENENFDLAQALLNSLKRQWPGDQNLAAAESMLQEAIANRQQIRDTKISLEQRKQNLLADARSAEENGELTSALGGYQAALVLDPENRQAKGGLERMRAALEAEGKTEDEIQILFDSAERRLDEQKEQLDSTLRSNASLRAKNDELIRQLRTIQERVTEKNASK